MNHNVSALFLLPPSPHPPSGLKVSESPTEATHLVAPRIEITPKLLLSVVTGLPIVAPPFLHELLRTSLTLDLPLPLETESVSTGHSHELK